MNSIASSLAISGYINLLVVIVILCVLTLGGFAYWEQEKTAARTRSFLFARAAPPEMLEMMKRRRMDVDRYLSQVPIGEIHRHVRNCRSCALTKVCKEVLADADGRWTDYSFCPNHRAFKGR